MPTCTHSAVSMLTACFASDAIAAAARRTGFVKRTSKLTGTLFLALVTFRAWSDATTTLAQWAAKVTQWDEQVEGSPEAIPQRLNQRALAFLQDMLRQALAKVQAVDQVCNDGLFTDCTKVYLADSTGFALPDSLHDLFPGSGGSAATAGATIQAGWDYQNSVVGPCALTPWNIPEQKYVDTVVAVAQTGILFRFELGYFKIKAFAPIAAAGAYFFSRLNHQTTRLHTESGHVQPLALASWLTTVAGDSTEHAMFLGAKERVACRRVAYRLPECIVNERRRLAKKKAKKKGSTPSKAHRALVAWNLFLTNVPHTIWQTPTIRQGYPIRWQVELSFTSWKSSRHLASIKTKKGNPTLCYLYGRMLLIVLNYALCPQLRATVWVKKQRELSVLKLVRHCQALADRWMQAIFQAEFVLRRFLQRACATAERLVATASRKRHTTAQILRESLAKQDEAIALMEAVNA